MSRVRVPLAVLGVTALALACVPGAAAAGDRAAPTDPGPLYSMVKDRDTRLQLQVFGRPDGRDMLYRISGAVYANAPGDTLAPKLRHGTRLFGFEGYNIRRLWREPGTNKLYALTREVVFYTDPKDPTKILREWTNPLDGKTYPVVPVNNLNVDFGPFPITPDFRLGPLNQVQRNLVQVSDIPPRTDLKARTGDEFGLADGVYTAMEMFDFYIDEHEAAKRSHGVPHGALEVSNSWVRSSPFPPFMCVAEKDVRANALYHARSWTLNSWNELEPFIKDEVERSYPAYKKAPDAPAPSESSWTSFWRDQLGSGALTWTDWCARNGRG
ncbi:DUF1838 family protein [Actinomadura gamaensis]|uniref:DUF1838 family protein n=1 Tax=Actinomadura gamaensis TaxID=1763541 RepID=A0ABV9TUY2_9ACTN